jgi:hypothetical protein
MKECILSCQAVNVAATLAELGPASSWMFLERVPCHWLESAGCQEGIRLTRFDAHTDWDRWRRGRVFGDYWELRWEDGQATYIGPERQLAGFHMQLDLSNEPKQTRYLLWGRREQGRFLELQVPRSLDYPFSSARVQLVVAEWFDESGEPIASRCVRLEEVP